MREHFVIQRPNDMLDDEWETFVERIHDELAERADALPFSMDMPTDGPLFDSAEVGRALVGVYGI